MTTVAALLDAADARLRDASPTPRLDAELLLAHVRGTGRARLVADLQDSVSDVEREQFATLIERRLDLEPVAYLTGEREFYGLPLLVDRRVLVPRPETELLVERAIRAARRHPRLANLAVADIGTGSGAIAVAVARHLPSVHLWAVDVSQDALDVARANVERHGLLNRVTLLHGHGLDVLPGPVDLLLSNPPYTVLAEVDENVRRHEPHLALDGGADGLDVIRELLRAAPRFIERGTMLIEIAAWQGVAARELATAVFPCAVVSLHQDLAGLDRLIEIEIPRPDEVRQPRLGS